MIAIRTLTRYARRLFRDFGIANPVSVREFGRGLPYSANFYGLHTELRGKRILWLNRRSRKGCPYTDRFILSILAHEVAHLAGSRHGKNFARIQRRATLWLRRYRREAAC